MNYIRRSNATEKVYFDGMHAIGKEVFKAVVLPFLLRYKLDFLQEDWFQSTEDSPECFKFHGSPCGLDDHQIPNRILKACRFPCMDPYFLGDFMPVFIYKEHSKVKS